jgi:hypothetical protein
MATALARDGGLFTAADFRHFLDRFLEESGNPSDALERLLLEQVAFGAMRVADLHAQAARAQSVEGAKVFAAAASRLLSEVRRLALAVKVYRARTPADAEMVRVAKVG